MSSMIIDELLTDKERETISKCIAKLIPHDEEKQDMVYYQCVGLPVHYIKKTRRLGEFGSHSGIGLHYVLMLSQFNELKVDTLLHELAHAIVYALWKITGHGKPWKMVMLMLGLQPNVIMYDAAFANAMQTTNPHIYKCIACGYIWRRSHKWRKEKIHSDKSCQQRGRIIYQGRKDNADS